MSVPTNLSNERIIIDAAQLNTVVRSTLNVLKVSLGENLDASSFEDDVRNSLEGLLNLMDQQSQLLAKSAKD